ncbi:MAG: PHP domain-containing protein [Candidatus Ancaeobacter aquaticus]|nr:PHP domain-containing protein [Candidatus Ancaeobacter aquaticus]
MHDTSPQPQEYIDLHIHTNYSDGTYSPSEVVHQASRIGLRAISITDHDTVDGIEEAMNAARDLSLEIIPGIELSADDGNNQMHILGYYIDWRNPTFNAQLTELSDDRLNRARSIVDKLNQIGVKIDFNEVMNISGKGTVGRMHIAQAMKKKGIVNTVQESFNKYIGNGRSAYTAKYKLRPGEAIKLIKDSGGVSVVAHPGLLKRQAIIEELIDLGLDGIEVYHTDHKPAAVKKYLLVAAAHNLIVSGGSDCHGLGKDKMLMGTVKVPYDVLERMKIKWTNNENS